MTIGSELCHVTSMSATQLTCKPSIDGVGNVDHAAHGSRPVVTVKVRHMQSNITLLLLLCSWEGAKYQYCDELVCLCVCLSVCLFARICRELHVQT